MKTTVPRNAALALALALASGGLRAVFLGGLFRSGTTALADVPTFHPPVEDGERAGGSGNTQRGPGRPPIPAREYLEGCRRSGFDPPQLACATCNVLPEAHRSGCLDCCRPYRTLDKRSKRYGAAVLVNTGHPDSVRELLEEDRETILSRKGPDRFAVYGDGGGGMDDPLWSVFGHVREPSAILWFDRPPPAGASLEELSAGADEVTVLSGRRGLGRDDLRDMLLALLPDTE